jgi:glycosyltransferase involved in cell wall biosynthesis
VGFESKAIMPGPAMEIDLPDILRVDYSCLESAEWWRSLGIDGLVLYSWGDPRYNRIARAIRTAGIRLVVNMDTVGLLSPVLGIGRFYRCMDLTHPLQGWRKWLKRGKQLLMPVRDYFCIKHLECADVIGALTPFASSNLKNYLRFYRKGALADRVQLVPHAVTTNMGYEGETKEKRIVVIGRWAPEDRWKKHPEFVVPALARALCERPDYSAVVVGAEAKGLEVEFADLVAKTRGSLSFVEFIPNDEIAILLRSSSISFCASRNESFHIATAEALCCGCSVVSHDSDSVASMRYFVDEGRSGALAESYTIEGLAEVLLEECGQWDAGGRDPRAISRKWTELLHADRVAGKIVELAARPGRPSARETGRQAH